MKTPTVEEAKYTFELDDDAGMYPVICNHKQIVVVCDGEEHARHISKLLNDEGKSVRAEERAKMLALAEKWEENILSENQVEMVDDLKQLAKETP